MRRARGAALLAIAACVFVVAVAAHGASDVARVDKAGWWSKRVAAQATVGATSFEVASGVDGDESIAALRVLITGSVTKSTLVISEAANQTTAVSVPKLQVCTTDEGWIINGNPGKYADAPKPNCAGAVALTRDDKGNWSADVTTMVATAASNHRSEMSLMVVPAEDKSLPIAPTFFVQFATARLAADGTPDVESTTEPSGSQAAPPAVPSSGSSTFTPPRVSTPAPAAPAATTAAPAPAPTTAPAPAVPSRLGGIPIASHRKAKQWGKLLWVVPLSALIAYGWVLFRKTLQARGTLAST